MKKGTKKAVPTSAFHQEIRTKINSLRYTTEETKAVYLKQLTSCKASSEIQELVGVIEAGEQQLYEIQQELFQTLESYIWKINDFRYLPMLEKRHWIEKLIACDFSEEMANIFKQVSEAEQKASQNNSGGWTIVKE